jgi:hypothetical protein
MAEIKLSGYTGLQAVMTTELNALGSSTGKAISVALDNTVPNDIWADFELAVTFASAPVLNAIVELYLLPSLDAGASYPDGSTTVLPSPNLYMGGFPVRAVNTAQVISLRGVPLPPGLFKVLVQNTTAQAFPASGSTLDLNSYKLQVA